MYADYSFYTSRYFGDTLTEKNASKWLSLASDELDKLTFDRLTNGFPENDVHADRVRKATCAIADALYYIDVHSRASSVQVSNDGKTTGVISSISSGRESVSYNTNNTAANKYAAAAADESSTTALINCIICKYIANVPDKYGVNLLYAGVD